MARWRDMAETFSEGQRYYKGTYLEIKKVYDETAEGGLFSSRERQGLTL